MRVTICGPNLPRPLCDRGDMHVHQAGCADLRKYPDDDRTRPGQKGWTIEASSVETVVYEVYDNQIEESEGYTWEDYVDDLYWAPCTSSLPRTEAEAGV